MGARRANGRARPANRRSLELPDDALAEPRRDREGRGGRATPRGDRREPWGEGSSRALTAAWDAAREAVRTGGGSGGPPTYECVRRDRLRWFAAGMALVVAGVVAASWVALRRGQASPGLDSSLACLASANENSAIVGGDRQQELRGLLGKTRTEVTNLLGTPYCTLPAAVVRSGAVMRRDAYRADGQKRLVVAYEGDRLVGFGIDPPDREPGDRKEIDLKQAWGLQAGTSMAGRPVVGGLGSLSVAYKGPVRAPADGIAYGNLSFVVADDQKTEGPESCMAFASPQLPAYMLQLCGLENRRQGKLREGQAIGSARQQLHAALLRHDGRQWMYVPPAPELFEALLDGDRG